MYKKDLALNNQQWLICPKSKPIILNIILNRSIWPVFDNFYPHMEPWKELPFPVIPDLEVMAKEGYPALKRAPELSLNHRME